MTKSVQSVLAAFAAGDEVSEADGTVLFGAQGQDLTQIITLADQLRQEVCGNQVGFVVNRNINFTNICYMGCTFCGFAKRREDAGAEWLSLETIVARATEAWERGATEVCIQGGIHPKMPGTYYRDIVLALKSTLPKLDIHAFSPFEIWYGAAKRNMSYFDFLADLQACGLGSLPGTAAEILDTEIRKQLTKDKLSAAKWVEIIRTAHKVGLPTTATIMYGHIDGPKHWAGHIALLRDIQKETGGFTELVPLSFVHYDSPLYLDNPGKVRPGPTRAEVDKMHAVSRIMLHGWVDNVQTSWTKLGPARAQQLLSQGVNDFGGTLMNESISRAAGSTYGQEVTAHEMVQIIRAAGRVPVQRNTAYKVLEIFANHDPVPQKPLVDRDAVSPIDFLSEDLPRFLKTGSD
ncbi:MAG: 5-amino-6-(D-ribitylamino)uracil--L-tyrosine 4-hydroxyphenyl transferase CofH [Rhodobacteraceae bacterium]|nr:5-amino-6-(D-ribitylamino)uracil--L-tyrosine 4-hydroxyphenyl transferase CofH [Paracoccaceae bacterium]